jgi:hypothetical protein
VNVEKLVMPMMLAIVVIAVASLTDGSATSLEHLPRFYLSQAVISFAAMFFLGPALVLGITSALRKGSRELLSFTVLFGAINSIGALAGQALFGTYIDISSISPGYGIVAHQKALSLGAVIALVTAIYLAVLPGIRIRRKLTDIRKQGLAPNVESTSSAPGLESVHQCQATGIRQLLHFKGTSPWASLRRQGWR